MGCDWICLFKQTSHNRGKQCVLYIRPPPTLFQIEGLFCMVQVQPILQVAVCLQWWRYQDLQDFPPNLSKNKFQTRKKSSADAALLHKNRKAVQPLVPVCLLIQSMPHKMLCKVSIKHIHHDLPQWF